jgi:hypothetical protein
MDSTMFTIDSSWYSFVFFHYCETVSKPDQCSQSETGWRRLLLMQMIQTLAHSTGSSNDLIHDCSFNIG